MNFDTVLSGRKLQTLRRNMLPLYLGPVLSNKVHRNVVSSKGASSDFGLYVDTTWGPRWTNLQGCTESKHRKQNPFYHFLGFLISHLLKYTAFQNIVLYFRDLLLSEMSRMIDALNRVVIQVYLPSAFSSWCVI
jgi:hypothetical protein